MVIPLNKIALYLGLFTALLTLLHFLGVVNPVGATIVRVVGMIK